MHIAVRSVLVAALAFVLAACSEPVAKGSCTGAVGSVAINGPIAEDSEFHRDDLHGGLEAAFVNLSYASGALRIAGHFTAMPSEAAIGTHSLVSPTSYVDAWRLESLPLAPQMTSGTLSIESATRDLIKGRFTMGFADGSEVRCDLEVPRDFTLDTDD